MARPKKYKIKLTDDELKELKSVIRKNKTSKTIRCRCQIIIDLDESHGKVLTHEQSAKSNGVCLATVTNTVKKLSLSVMLILIMQGVCSMDVLKPVSLNLPVVRCRKYIQGGPSCFWKRRQKLFLILRSAVRQSEEP